MEMGGFVTTDNVSWSDIVTMSQNVAQISPICQKKVS